MTLQPIKDVSEYKRLEQTLRDRFESEKTGDQSLLEEQTKKYKPLLLSQKDLSATIQDVANMINAVLLPPGAGRAGRRAPVAGHNIFC